MDILVRRFLRDGLLACTMWYVFHFFVSSILFTFLLQLFTGLPPLALGLFEQDVSADVRLANPSLYHYSQKNKGFNVKVLCV